MPRNRSEKRPALPSDVDVRLEPLIWMDCGGHVRDGKTPQWLRETSLTRVGHADGQAAFIDLSQDLKNQWNNPSVRKYMAVYMEYLYATQQK